MFQSRQTKGVEDLATAKIKEGLVHLSPVEYVVHIFSGVRAAGRAAGRHGTVVAKWRKSGRIPNTAYIPLLEAAKERGLDLTANDLIFGRSFKQSESQSG